MNAAVLEEISSGLRRPFLFCTRYLPDIWLREQLQAFENQTRSHNRKVMFTGLGARPQQAFGAFVGTNALLAK